MRIAHRGEFEIDEVRLVGREVDLGHVAEGLPDQERAGAGRVGEDEERPALPGPVRQMREQNERNVREM